VLNATVTDENAQQSLTALLYGYSADEISSGEDDLVLLMHLNNDSSVGENDTHVYDFSSNGNNGTCSGTSCPSFSTDGGKFGGAFEFDGENDYFDTNDINGIELHDVTFSFWGKVDSITRDNDFITKGAHNTLQPLIIWFDDTVGTPADVGAGNTDALSVLIYDGTTQHWIATPSNSIDTNWHHIVVVVKPSTNWLAIYVDGVLEVSNTKTWNGIENTGTAIRFGAANPTSISPLDGTIDEIAIWNRSLSAQEIWRLLRLLMILVAMGIMEHVLIQVFALYLIYLLANLVEHLSLTGLMIILLLLMFHLSLMTMSRTLSLPGLNQDNTVEHRLFGAMGKYMIIWLQVPWIFLIMAILRGHLTVIGLVAMLWKATLLCHLTSGLLWVLSEHPQIMLLFI